MHAGIARLVNLYGWCTFDVGATLCEWMETEAPATLQAMVAGDAASVRRWGHGNAIAAPYHHVILPLASPRDRRTEVRWGIADFQRRFAGCRKACGCPSAPSMTTLACWPRKGSTQSRPSGANRRGDARPAVRWRGAAGRTLTILPYDGGLAGDVRLRLPRSRRAGVRLAFLDDGRIDFDAGHRRRDLRASSSQRALALAMARSQRGPRA
jgi:hypothetical protein